MTLVFDKFSIRNYFLVQTPVNVGAKYNFPSFSNLMFGYVHTPIKVNLLPAPGISFRVIDIVDLYSLYSLGLNYSATMQKLLA